VVTNRRSSWAVEDRSLALDYRSLAFDTRSWKRSAPSRSAPTTLGRNGLGSAYTTTRARSSSSVSSERDSSDGSRSPNRSKKARMPLHRRRRKPRERQTDSGVRRVRDRRPSDAPGGPAAVSQ